ncbi:hypothetical protein [Nocardioides sp.]|uniref:hypothetical protein n=1 Tax=Nocardioides sp. TaxID=35761 RepID=UPI0037844967
MGGRLRHALSRGAPTWGVAATLVASALLVLPSSPAAAVSAGRPIAVGVGDDGTAYVGFASGGRLLRLDGDGGVDGSLTLDQDAPVDGLAVDADGDVWVDYGDSVSELAPDGTLLKHFAHSPQHACPADAAHNPARYGGIAVTSSRIYVAGRCRGDVEVYSMSGVLQAAVDLPGSGYPRGVDVAPAYEGIPARLYVTVPDQAVVQVYNLGSLGSGSRPVRTLRVQRGTGYARPVPAGVVADERGQVAVLDSANNALYLYNGNQGYGFYRTLGHPPRPGSTLGHLDHPRAVGAPDVGSNYWVADTGNGRVQRWTNDGTTRWMTDTTVPGDPGAPVNTARPVISGTVDVGETLTCSNGSWSGAPTSYTRVWQRDGVTIDGATDPAYDVVAGDAGTDLTCVVTAHNAAGASGPASSAAVTVPGGPVPPVRTCRGSPSVRIDGGARYAHDPYVVLTVRAPAGATTVQISNDSFAHYDTKVLTRSCRYAWTLPKQSSRTPKTVRVRFPGAGSAGGASDSIVLDSAAPVIHRVSAHWSNPRHGWVVKISATDQGTGIATVTYGRSPTSNQTVRWGKDIVSWDSGWISYFRVKDRAGNVSGWYHLTGI